MSRDEKKGTSMFSQTTLLIVEDDVAVMAALYEVLHDRGYRVITARSTQEAETALQHLGEAAIDLVISDIHLTRRPEICEGYVLYQHWTATYPSVPFILMSAYPGSRDLPDIQARAVCFLEKPFETEALMQCIQDTLACRARQDQPRQPGPGRDHTVVPSADAATTERGQEPPPLNA